jgi:hypothetical protein
MVRVVRRAIAGKLGEWLGAAGQRRIERLKDQDGRPLPDHEPIAATVERPARRRRVVVAG